MIGSLFRQRQKEPPIVQYKYRPAVLNCEELVVLSYGDIDPTVSSVHIETKGNGQIWYWRTVGWGVVWEGGWPPEAKEVHVPQPSREFREYLKTHVCPVAFVGSRTQETQ